MDGETSRFVQGLKQINTAFPLGANRGLEKLKGLLCYAWKHVITKTQSNNVQHVIRQPYCCTIS